MLDHKPSVIAVSINSNSGTLVQARNINAILGELSKKTSAPIYSFGEDAVGGAALVVLASAKKVFASKHSMIGQFGFSDYHFDATKLCEEYGIKIKDFPSASRMPPTLSEVTSSLSESDKKWVLSVLEMQQAELRREVLTLRQKAIEDKGITNEILEQDLFGLPAIFAREAQRLGIIDELGTFDAVIQAQYPDALIKEIANKQLRNKDIGEVRTQMFQFYSPLAESAAKVENL